MVHGALSGLLMTRRYLTRDSMKYRLPSKLIAQKPAKNRTGSRLLVADPAAGRIVDSTFERLSKYLDRGDLLVLNDTKVFRARLEGRKASTGGKVEVFLLKRIKGNLWKAMVRPGKSIKPGRIFRFQNGLSCSVERRLDSEKGEVRFTSSGRTEDVLRKVARVPLPPYIKRDPEELDDERYQTVFASKEGAVAAPTAGLHFSDSLLRRLEENGVRNVTLTLHVGPGTFQPLRKNRLEHNELEPEEYEVGAGTLAEIRDTRNRGGRVVAVGTTSTRVLETVNINATETLTGETEVFIFPPYRFRNVDALITNFHLPESSLLCLVAAFMGYDFMMEAYRHAVAESYRFYSYGDAMLIERRANT